MENNLQMFNRRMLCSCSFLKDSFIIMEFDLVLHLELSPCSSCNSFVFGETPKIKRLWIRLLFRLLIKPHKIIIQSHPPLKFNAVVKAGGVMIIIDHHHHHDLLRHVHHPHHHHEKVLFPCEGMQTSNAACTRSPLIPAASHHWSHQPLQ